MNHKTSKGISISRTFNAPRESVWKAWTTEDKVKEWWGPKDFTAPSIKIDLRVGGKYIYCMHGPKNSQFDMDLYSAGVYKEIVPNKKLVVSDYFSDASGNKIDPTKEGMSSDMPSEMDVVVKFESVPGNKTKLVIDYPKPKSEVQFKAMKKSGMEKGWNQSLDKLEQNLGG